jgi:hypothetical protein
MDARRHRSVEKHFQEGTAEPQVPPLRCAPVGMTRGEMVLAERVVDGQGEVVAEQEPFFITLGGPAGP